jgi:hypothetical protein
MNCSDAKVCNRLNSLPSGKPEVDAVSAAFRTALAASRMTELDIPLRDRSTNQSIGNQVAEFFVLINRS